MPAVASQSGILGFADAFKLELITPPMLQSTVLTPAPPVIDCQSKLRGNPLHWQSEITFRETPIRFVDVQRRGQYRFAVSSIRS